MAHPSNATRIQIANSAPGLGCSEVAKQPRGPDVQPDGSTRGHTLLQRRLMDRTGALVG